MINLSVQKKKSRTFGNVTSTYNTISVHYSNITQIILTVIDVLISVTSVKKSTLIAFITSLDLQYRKISS